MVSFVAPQRSFKPIIMCLRQQQRVAPTHTASVHSSARVKSAIAFLEIARFPGIHHGGSTTCSGCKVEPGSLQTTNSNIPLHIYTYYQL